MCFLSELIILWIKRPCSCDMAPITHTAGWLALTMFCFGPQDALGLGSAAFPALVIQGSCPQTSFEDILKRLIIKYSPSDYPLLILQPRSSICRSMRSRPASRKHSKLIALGLDPKVRFAASLVFYPRGYILRFLWYLAGMLLLHHSGVNNTVKLAFSNEVLI